MIEQPRDRTDQLDDHQRGADDHSRGDQPVESEPSDSEPVEPEPLESEPAAPVVATADRDMRREEEGAAVAVGAVEPPAEHDGPPTAVAPSGPRSGTVEEPFELFSISDVEGYRRRWDALQAGFVDDPPAAVQQAESLVSELMQRMADRHATLRKGLGGGAGEEPDTETMRQTLRRYRAFFNSLVR